MIRRWKRRVEVWLRRAQPYKPPNEFALDLYESFKGEAFKEIEFVNLDRVDHRDGVTYLINVMDAPFAEESRSRKGTLLRLYEALKRKRGEHPRAYCNRYDRTERQLLDVKIDIKKTYDSEARANRFARHSPSTTRGGP